MFPPFNKQRKEERETAEQTWEEAAESFAFSWAGWKDVWKANATSKHMECDWICLLRVTVNKPSQANHISALAREPRCDNTFRPYVNILWKRRNSKQLCNKIRRAKVQKRFHQTGLFNAEKFTTAVFTLAHFSLQGPDWSFRILTGWEQILHGRVSRCAWQSLSPESKRPASRRLPASCNLLFHAPYHVSRTRERRAARRRRRTAAGPSL